MAKHHATTLTAIGIALLTLPGVSAALPAIIQPLVDVIGPQGWSGLYQYPALIHSILFTLLFGGISVKILGERLGKMPGWIVGIILAIALTLFMETNNIRLDEFGWLAVLVLAVILTWLIYGLIEPLANNRILSFAAAFVIGYTLLKILLKDDTLASLGNIATWLGLVYAICILLLLFLIIKLVTGNLSGAGSGGGWGSGASSFNTGSGFLDKMDQKWGEYRSNRQEERQKNAEQLATVVKNQLLENEQALAKNLDMEKATVASIRQGLEQLQQYVTNVERNVEPLRGTVRGASASADLAAYRQSIAQQRGSLDAYFTQIQNYARPLFEKQKLLENAKGQAPAAQAAIQKYIDGVQVELKKSTGAIILQKQGFELVKAYVDDAKKQYATVTSKAQGIKNAKGDTVDFGLGRVANTYTKLEENEKAIAQYEQAFAPIAALREELKGMLQELQRINVAYRDEAKVEMQYAELLKNFKANILKSQDLLNKYVNSLSSGDYNNTNKAFAEAVQACETIERNQAQVATVATKTAEMTQRMEKIQGELKQILEAESGKNLVEAANTLRDTFTSAAAISYMSQTLSGVVANYEEVAKETDPAKRAKKLASFRGRITRTRSELVKDFKKILQGDDKHVKAAASVGVPDNYLAKLIHGIKEDQEVIDKQIVRVEQELTAQSTPQAPSTQ